MMTQGEIEEAARTGRKHAVQRWDAAEMLLYVMATPECLPPLRSSEEEKKTPLLLRCIDCVREAVETIG